MWNKIKSIFSSNDELEQIGLFQLEGLIRNQVPFLLLDLRKKMALPGSKKLEHLLASGQKVERTNVESFLEEKNIGSDHPVVLICDNGKGSKKLAQSLRKKGRVNIYVVEGGSRALVRDLT